MSQSYASDLLNSQGWFILLAVIGNFYAAIAITQVFHLFPEDQSSLFAIWTYIPRFSGPLLQPNLAGLFLNIIIASLFVQAIRSSFNKSWILFTILPIGIILASNSRSAILLLAIITITLFILTSEKKLFLAYFSPAFLAAFVIALSWNQVLLQLSGGITLGLGSRLAEGGIADRLNLWVTTINLFFEHPWLGIGYGNLSSHFAEAQALTHITYPSLPSMDASTYWSHNIILQMFAEGGILAGVFILLFLTLITIRGKNIISQTNCLDHAAFLPLLIVSLIIIHGMISISIYQGFFLSLLGLFLAGLFPSQGSSIDLEYKINIKLIFLFIPAIYCSFTWFQFVSTQVQLRAIFDDPPSSPRFIAKVSDAIDNPWLARSGIEYLLVNMELSHSPTYQWLQAYPYMYHAWLLTQEPLTLRRLIVHAHLLDNRASETYLARLYLHAFPNNPWNKKLQSHIINGHLKHEPLFVY